jgi:queuine/archaeosine tRNA-ribosyltransferase
LLHTPHGTIDTPVFMRVVYAVCGFNPSPALEL